MRRVLLALALLLPLSVLAQDGSALKLASAKAAAEGGESALRSGSISTEAAIAMPSSPSELAMGDEATRSAYLQALQTYYDYRSSGYRYRSRVCEWQLLSSRIIFGVVLLLVLAGLYFAAIQVRTAMTLVRGPQRSTAPVDAAPMLTTQLELSAKGVVINSSVLGLLLLVVSLAFFYLYLTYVYPISNVF